ncbi:MAG: flagellar basal body L-ring protein FlgH [Myxococcota bacterium]
MSRAALVLLLPVLGCAGLQVPGLEISPPPIAPPPVPKLRSQPQAEGSLWRGETSRRFLAFENRARRVGDLLTVQIAESAMAENEATTELERKSNFDINIDSDVSLQTLITRPILNLLGFLGFTEQKTNKVQSTNVEVLDASTKSDFDGEGTVKREASFTTVVACLVTEITGAGLMRIEGERYLRINNETQIIRISGYVRPEDVRIDNTIPSTLIANADIHYGGVGLVSEQQRGPWGYRLLNLLIPF